MDQLITFIKKYTPLSHEAKNNLTQLVNFETYKKNDFILQQGQRCHKVWFIKSGLIRKFYLEDGKEITTWIHAENELFTSMHSYFQDESSTEYIQAYEDVSLLSMTKENSHKLSKFPEIELFSSKVLQEQFSKIDKVVKQFFMMNAQDKYNMLQKHAPYIIKRAKLGHIASIMGVTQETLSRIRAKR